MEHNTDNNWALPQEINELIFGLCSVAELCKLRVVSKSIRDSLSIQRIWKETCLKEFDLEFIDEDSNWIELAARYKSINSNIRNARVLVSALAVTRLSSDRMYTGESYIKDDESIIVNWLRTTGRGSSALDDVDHSAIVNINTRREEQSIKLDKSRSLIMIGDRLAELDWNSYSVRPYFSNIALKQDSGSNSAGSIPTPKGVRTILSNSDPTKKHVVVIVASENGQFHSNTILLNVYDLNEQRMLKTFTIKKFTENGSYHDSTVLLHGDFVYALQVHNVLRVYNWTSEIAEGDRIKIPLTAQFTTLFGAHKSLVFGFSCETQYSNSGWPWLFDLNKKTMQLYVSADPMRQVNNMMVHCGVLVVLTGQFMHFLDYRSDPTKLSLISTLQLDEVYRTTLQPMKDGQLFVSGYNSGAKIIDFEHANDECEILFVTSTGWTQKSTQIQIKAFELVSQAKTLLRTDEFVSRYFKKKSTRRYGIIYLMTQNKGGGQLVLSNPVSITHKSPEYNTPYMYYKMMHNSADKEARIVWAIPMAVKEFYGSAIIFYEEWTGTRWKLSKPKNWKVAQHN